MKRLLDNQTIRIDDHRSDGKSIHNWADSSSNIHLHKSSNGKSSGYYDIRIPLNTDSPPSVKFIFKNGEVSSILPRKIRNEIKDIFRDKSKRIHFLNDVYQTLGNFNWVDSKEERKRIAKIVGDFFEIEFLQNYNKKPHTKILLASDCDDIYQIIFNYEQHQIFVGQLTFEGMQGIGRKPKKLWIQSVVSHLEYILSIDSERERERYLQVIANNISGISSKTVCQTLKYIRRMYY